MMDDILEDSGLGVDHRLSPAAGRESDTLSSFVGLIAALGTLYRQRSPRLVLAVGDTSTVVAAALAARKTGAAFGHIEAGLRAFSRELPEEEHRICADTLAELLFAPTPIAVANLRRERVNGAIHLTGNPILDVTRGRRRRPQAERRGVVVTLHRQETVDHCHRLAGVLRELAELCERYEVEWPVHPRTAARVREFGLHFPKELRILPPATRSGFLDRLERALFVVTDSGGVQEEAAILGVPCVTMRSHTERPETLRSGLGVLLAPGSGRMMAVVRRLLAAPGSPRPRPELYGDGTAGEQIASACASWLAAGEGHDVCVS